MLSKITIVTPHNYFNNSEHEHILHHYNAKRVTTVCGCGECDNIIDSYYFNAEPADDDDNFLSCLIYQAENDDCPVRINIETEIYSQY